MVSITIFLRGRFDTENPFGRGVVRKKKIAFFVADQKVCNFWQR
jgi:hypothetical protein